MKHIWIFVLLVYSVGSAAFCQSADKVVCQIEIQTGWGGLGTPQNAHVLVKRHGDHYLRDGKPIDASLIDALVEALNVEVIPKPQMGNLGITPQWLAEHRASAEKSLPGQFFDATPGQKALFDSSFVDPAMMAKVTADLFTYSKSDDYPHGRVEITFEDGSKVTAKSNSYYAFMIPWSVSGKGETFNAEISRALSALLPGKAPDKERLAATDMVSELAETLMQQIEPQWKMRGVEDRSGDALRALRSAYTVKAADINPYHDVAFGQRWSEKGPHETNLQVTLHKANFPAGMNEHVVLLYEHDKVQGLEDFLKTGDEYESLVLSVPWLVEYSRQHPREMVTLEHVRQTSFSDHALESFAADMKARGREDLIPIVKAQQSQIALLKIDFVYWLLFPDRHMMLWRFEGPRGFLKWKQADFPAGECGAYYRVNDGGCSGREVTAEGELFPDHAPRDLACVAEFRKIEERNLPKAEALFSVTQHNRGGFIDRSGRIRIPLCFDGVGDFSEGLARFERDGLWGYIDESGIVAIEPRFPWAQDFSEGLARVQVSGTVLGYDGKWGFIDRSGKIVIPPVFGWRMDSGDAEEGFHGGLAKVEVNYKSGYIDKTGKMVIPAEFSLAYPFSEGLAAVTKDESMKSGWGFIDAAGKWVIPPQFEWASSFNEDLSPVNRKHDCGYIDKTGSYALRPPVSPDEKDCAAVWGDFREGLSRWKFGSTYGFIDHRGEVVIPAKFDLVLHFSEGLAAVQIQGEWGFIDKSGNLVIPPRMVNRIEDFHHGLAQFVTKDGKWGYIDRTGGDVWGPTRQGDD